MSSKPRVKIVSCCDHCGRTDGVVDPFDLPCKHHFHRECFMLAREHCGWDVLTVMFEQRCPKCFLYPLDLLTQTALFDEWHSTEVKMIQRILDHLNHVEKVYESLANTLPPGLQEVRNAVLTYQTYVLKVKPEDTLEGAHLFRTRWFETVKYRAATFAVTYY